MCVLQNVMMDIMLIQLMEMSVNFVIYHVVPVQDLFPTCVKVVRWDISFRIVHVLMHVIVVATPIQAQIDANHVLGVQLVLTLQLVYPVIRECFIRITNAWQHVPMDIMEIMLVNHAWHALKNVKFAPIAQIKIAINVPPTFFH